jgi:signal transduction histidine kinase
MQIKHRLTYQFISLVAVILSISSLAIYFSSADYRRDEFYTRLYNKATITAKLLIEVEEVDAELLKRIEKNNPVGMPEERIVIYNYSNVELFSTDDEQILKADTNLLNQIRLEHLVQFEQDEYEVLGFLYSDTYYRNVVLIAAIDVYGKTKLNNLRTNLFIVFGISIVLVFIAGWIYATRALKPINTVIEQVDSISITSINLRVEEGNGKDEIAKLAATFNNMLDRLENAFNVQKNFIANASHELRTPLAIITGQLEVVLMNDRSEQEYKETIISVLEDMKNLAAISNRLLLLAQTSAEKINENVEELRVDDIIWQARSELIKLHPEYKIQVDLNDTLNDKELTVLGNAQLFKIVFINLMDNACKYSGEKTAIVHMKANDRKTIIEVIDHGIGIDYADIDNVFEPFYRGKNALFFKGHGIGLSLAKRIVTLFKGDITVNSTINQGSTFKISFFHI